MEEIWKDIEGFPEYQISSFGRVKSLKCGREKILKPSFHRYYYINLQKDKKNYKRSIHRLLAIAFIPNPDNLPVIDHIDNNPTNNSISNLRWASLSQNRINRSKEPSYISETKYNSFLVYIKKENNVFRKCFKTLEEATMARNTFLSSLN